MSEHIRTYSLTLPLVLERKQVDNGEYTLIGLDFRTIPEWTLGLLLIREQLTEALRVTVPSGAELLIRLDPRTTPQMRAKAGWKHKAFCLEFGRDDLETWIDFFLRYIRDGRAAVSHLDLEARSHAGGKMVDIVVKVDRFGPSLPLEEAKLLWQG